MFSVQINRASANDGDLIEIAINPGGDSATDAEAVVLVLPDDTHLSVWSDGTIQIYRGLTVVEETLENICRRALDGPALKC